MRGAGVLFILGCTAASSTQPDATGDPCTEATISVGVFGRVLTQCGDIGGPCPGEPEADVSLSLYRTADMPPVGDPIATTITDGDGFYQLNAAQGSGLCVGVGVNPVCTTIVIGTTRDRWDYDNADLAGRRWHHVVCH